jgi:hypothetical protein
VRVGFYTAYERDPMHYVLGAAMIRSVKAAMPGVEIVQLTDETSPPVLGVDDVRRLPREPLCVGTARHYSLCEGEWLLLDTDILVQKDVRHLFDGATWDFAVTDRSGTLVSGESLNPWCGDYNIGVFFQRNGRPFWERVVEELLKMESKHQKWMGNQIVSGRLLKEGGWNFAILPGIEFNYPPKHQKDDFSHASIVHFKGPKRKFWMWQRCASV